MKGLKEILTNVEALRRDLEELGVEVTMDVSIDLPLKDLEERIEPR
ncbi:MAG: hypothetical protein HWN68_19030 [Desulfobacterales bacterium]|nr:hypothetical protein [Desulfobacterales bacterium]